MKFRLQESYKDKKFIEDAFKDAVYQTIPNKNAAEQMIKSKLELLDEFDWEEIEDYINGLEFPLLVIRGLKVNNKDEINLTPGNLGINWTIDPDLFFDPSSSFNDLDYFVIGTVTENQIDWPNTIQNYIYYSLRSDIINLYPETEITLKQNEIPSQLNILSRDELFDILQDQ